MIDKFLQYIQLEKRYSDHTVKAYKKDLQQFCSFLEEQFGLNATTQVDLVRMKHIRKWLVALMVQKSTSTTVNRKLSSLKSYFAYLQRQGFIANNVAQNVQAPKQAARKLPVFIEAKKLSTLLDSYPFTDTFTQQRDKLVLNLLYSTGIRNAELIALSDASVDDHNANLLVMGKGSKMRSIPISSALLNDIKNYQQLRNNYFNFSLPLPNMLVTNKGNKLYPKWVYNTVKNYLSMLTSQEKRSPHVLRHSIATHMLNNGADLNALKKMLGHSSLASTQVYTHNTIEKLKKSYKQAHPKA